MKTLCPNLARRTGRVRENQKFGQVAELLQALFDKNRQFCQTMKYKPPHKIQFKTLTGSFAFALIGTFYLSCNQHTDHQKSKGPANSDSVQEWRPEEVEKYCLPAAGRGASVSPPRRLLMSFGWQTRLAKNHEINRVFREGKRHNGGVFMLVAAKRESEELKPFFPRMCVVVSRKVSKKAVDRNRIKRRFRSLFRENYHAVPQNFDLVLIARASTTETSYSNLRQRFFRVCEALARQ
jgi:ribonuclease P protein component